MDARPHNPENKELKSDQSYNTTDPDVTPRRVGGDDSIAESSPVDSRADEKVIVNTPKESIALPINTPDKNVSDKKQAE